jgi:hypothetical protein
MTQTGTCSSCSFRPGRERRGRRQGGGRLGHRGEGSIVFVLASSVRVPLAELATANGLFPGLEDASYITGAMTRPARCRPPLRSV